MATQRSSAPWHSAYGCGDFVQLRPDDFASIETKTALKGFVLDEAARAEMNRALGIFQAMSRIADNTPAAADVLDYIAPLEQAAIAWADAYEGLRRGRDKAASAARNAFEAEFDDEASRQIEEIVAMAAGEEPPKRPATPEIDFPALWLTMLRIATSLKTLRERDRPEPQDRKRPNERSAERVFIIELAETYYGAAKRAGVSKCEPKISKNTNNRSPMFGQAIGPFWRYLRETFRLVTDRMGEPAMSDGSLRYHAIEALEERLRGRQEHPEKYLAA